MTGHRSIKKLMGHSIHVQHIVSELVITPHVKLVQYLMLLKILGDGECRKYKLLERQMVGRRNIKVNVAGTLYIGNETR